MIRHISPTAALITGFTCWIGASLAADSQSQGPALKPVAAFAAINDERARSAALFTEAGRVIQSPRCLNCHPVTRQPTQGNDLHPHVPFMTAGPADHGVPGLPCKSCHGAANTATLGSAIQSVPGNSRWGLAPASMAWQGKSLKEICGQLKDTSRNGGRTLAAIHEHMTEDPLVGWAWHPGDGRAPAPGSQAEFGALIEAWISTGAQCPAS
jgi:hypothetical protein